MTNQEIVDYIRDWFPIGDPHFEDSSYGIDFLELIAGGIR